MDLGDDVVLTLSIKQQPRPEFFEFERSEDSQLTVPACLLTDKTSTASSEETPSTNVPFFLLQSGKGQLTFKRSLFSEESTSPPFSSQLSPGSRCTLKCVLLHEFPAGSISAEKIVTAISAAGEYPDLVPTSSPIVLLAYLQGQDLGCFSPFSILICTHFFLVDAFSRIEVIEASPLSDPRLFSSSTTPTHTSPPSAVPAKLSANLFSASGTIIAVDSECSQLWPLCASCLSDDLEPCPPDPELQLPPSGSSSDDALLCSRCLARLSRPYYAVEVIVEAQFNSTVCPAALSADAEDVHRIHVCMESARVCELLGLSANKLHQASCLDPAQLIDRDVGVISGVLIHLPRDPDNRPSRRKSSSFKSAHSFVVGRLYERFMRAQGWVGQSYGHCLCRRKYSLTQELGVSRRRFTDDSECLVDVYPGSAVNQPWSALPSFSSVTPSFTPFPFGILHLVFHPPGILLLFRLSVVPRSILVIWKTANRPLA
nr:unnamed protein product [Spirometra erinaceieuropaei]